MSIINFQWIAGQSRNTIYMLYMFEPVWNSVWWPWQSLVNHRFGRIAMAAACHHIYLVKLSAQFIASTLHEPSTAIKCSLNQTSTGVPVAQSPIQWSLIPNLVLLSGLYTFDLILTLTPLIMQSLYAHARYCIPAYAGARSSHHKAIINECFTKSICTNAPPHEHDKSYRLLNPILPISYKHIPAGFFS